MSGKRSDRLKPSGLWISDAADRIDGGDAMALNHAVLQATIHGLRLDSLLVELLRSDHEIHRDVRDALARLIDASETDEGKAKPVALKVECREKNVTGTVTRSQKVLYETRTDGLKLSGRARLEKRGPHGLGASAFQKARRRIAVNMPNRSSRKSARGPPKWPSARVLGYR